MRSGLIALGAVLVLVGFVWTGQGANLIGGSFMTGQTTWLIAGLATIVVGGVLIWWAIRGYRRFP